MSENNTREHLFEVQVRAPHGKYQTKYSFRTHDIVCSRAWLWYSGINIHSGHSKRLVRDGKVIARQFSSK